MHRTRRTFGFSVHSSAPTRRRLGVGPTRHSTRHCAPGRDNLDSSAASMRARTFALSRLRVERQACCGMDRRLIESMRGNGAVPLCQWSGPAAGNATFRAPQTCQRHIAPTDVCSPTLALSGVEYAVAWMMGSPYVSWLAKSPSPGQLCSCKAARDSTYRAAAQTPRGKLTGTVAQGPHR